MAYQLSGWLTPGVYPYHAVSFLLVDILTLLDRKDTDVPTSPTRTRKYLPEGSRNAFTEESTYFSNAQSPAITPPFSIRSRRLTQLGIRTSSNRLLLTSHILSVPSINRSVVASRSNERLSVPATAILHTPARSRTMQSKRRISKRMSYDWRKARWSLARYVWLCTTRVTGLVFQTVNSKIGRWLERLVQN